MSGEGDVPSEPGREAALAPRAEPPRRPPRRRAAAALHLHVDARLLHGGGIGRYLRELSSRWLLRPEVRRICFFGRPEELAPFLAAHDARGIGAVVAWRDRPYSPLAQARWPVLARRCAERPDITFFPHYDVPLVRHPTPSVVAVHDLIHFDAPRAFPWWKRAAGRVLLRGALERAAAVVTVSDASRHAICQFAPTVAGKVRVVRNGVGGAFRPLPDAETRVARDAWGHLRPFLLCVGPAKAHKNLGHAVRVLAALPAEPAWGLVLVGPDEAERDHLVAAAGHPEVRARVVVTGIVTDEQLRVLYNLASVVVVPSTIEGFGLPVLEARACGARVLAGDLPWARELAASGVELVPGWNPGTWARTIEQTVVDHDDPGRDAWHMEWSWERASNATFDLLREAGEVGDGSGPL